MKVSESILSFLTARQTPYNADLVARWHIGLETQVNVAVGNGEPVAGKRSTWSDGINTWHSIRIPKNAATEPDWTDYNISYPLDVHAEGIGTTGWDWQQQRSVWFGYDFDAITGHAKGIGIADDDLANVREAACALPYVEVRRSTGGKGLHLYVYLDGIPTANHTEHAALSRCVLGKMSAEVGFDFASQIDACGHVMWIWHRKLSVENRGLEILKPATCKLTDLPSNWKDHIEVVRGKRSKVRIQGVPDAAVDPFDQLTSSRRQVSLDDDHKAQIESLMQTGATTLWVADHHLLQTHTCALQTIKEEMKLKGVFETISDGKDLGTPNCFCFPLPDGAWKVCRFSPGIAEAPTWTQDEKGWTTCFFNKLSNLTDACRLYNGAETESGGFRFTDIQAACKAAEAIGQILDLTGLKREVGAVTLKPHKDGRLIVVIDKPEDMYTPSPPKTNASEITVQRYNEAKAAYNAGLKDYEELKTWVTNKKDWMKIFDVQVEQENELQTCEYDDSVRGLVSNNEVIGIVIKSNNEWVRQSTSHAKLILQSRGISDMDADSILGGSLDNAWRIVNLPFHAEYPGGRQWNMDAAQFKFKAAELSDNEVPYHPHWDMIYNHIGSELTPVLQNMPWAQQGNIKTGADYLRAWTASVFRYPFSPTPYLFLFGSENCGKSIFFESLQLLVTKGVVKADHALGKTEFNGELAGAIICAVEEIDVTKNPGAHAKIKDWVTSKTIPIRRMRHDVYAIPNTTHWVQTANTQYNCPVFEGDTRITVIRVPDLNDDVRVVKYKMEEALEQEAPHFLHTIMNLELPPVIDRLRVPIIVTASKKRVAEDNRTVLEAFIAENCVVKENACEITYQAFYDLFQTTVDPHDLYKWRKIDVRRGLPIKHSIITGQHNAKYVANLAWKPVNERGVK